MYNKRRCIKINSDESAETQQDLVVEVPVTIYVNGRQAVTAMASPEMLKEYATGFLVTESVVNNPDEIESVQVDGTKVSIITLNPRKIIFSKKTVLSGCGGTATVIDYSRLPFAPKGRIFGAKRIQDAVSEIKLSEEKKGAGEIQYAGIFSASDTIAIAGDIGRDNALDKSIGAAVLKKTPLNECFAVISGRISSEIVRKCLYAQIPVIVSRGAATSLAYDIGLERDMTLLGLVSASKMILYTGGHRIVGQM
ncbi:formate dehydrogenase accessory sulfurtransferase FdhD [Methanoplanus sp. FWC-SCC4]|uniref:Formate dehydrogenase accessory sulfurtransferase FdhD n=1 Tax=Methanochimaera problematica TaxID=2609417 RepID=A0AA97FAZ1_9EURY|nr:formate dehydrogenase accessory sulfurtransferase FdhD [Methanoplanus sp. FWC-SCC4]WOF15567.1 formate dehydrogenase accessory sulfurtransferase FdhD [Methanoplanus sp. FWC-SCC4]